MTTENTPEDIGTKPTRKRSTTKTSPTTKKTTRPSRKTSTDVEASASEKPVEKTEKTEKKTAPTRRRTKKAEPSENHSTAVSDDSEATSSSKVVDDVSGDTPAPKTRRRVTRKKTDTTKTTRSSDTSSGSAHADLSDDEPDHRPVKKTTRRRSTRATSKTADDSHSIPPKEDVATESSAPVEEKPSFFAQLNLSAPILRAVEEMGYTQPTPIQEQAIPEILSGRDVLGVAQTGTGKTASFTLPLLEKLSKSRARARMPRSLILEPTRELALQVAENFERYGKHLRLTHALLIGGGNMNEQRELLNRGVDVLIATPGRLLDLFNRGGLLLTQTGTLVIDEADRMLDMGFIPDIERIVSLLPRSRQTLFFSATMAPEIRRLTETFLSSPREITIARQSSVASTIIERLFLVEKSDKPKALRTLLRTEHVQNAVVFCNRKRDVDTLNAYLARQGFAVGHLHGDLTQTLRFETLERFRSGDLKILVCSDIAARGLDVSGLSHVFNYDLPFNAEDYVHRIGRTGRAGKEGHAFTLVTPPDDQNLLEAVETLTKKKIEHGMIDGFPVLGWSQNMGDTSRSSTSTKSKPPRDTEKGQRKQKTRQDADRPSRARAAKAPPSKGRLLPPVPEQNGFQEGFGDYVPAFMTISFRPPKRHDD